MIRIYLSIGLAVVGFGMLLVPLIDQTHLAAWQLGGLAVMASSYVADPSLLPRLIRERSGR